MYICFIKEELHNIQLMVTNYVSKHSRDHADSESVSYVWLDCKEAKFVGNKQTCRHSTLLLIQIILLCNLYILKNEKPVFKNSSSLKETSIMSDFSDWL